MDMGGRNPFAGQYGANPLYIPCDLRFAQRHRITNYVRPPPLPAANLPTPLKFLEQIYPERRVHLFKVLVDDRVRLLKVVRGPSVRPPRFR